MVVRSQVGAGMTCRWDPEGACKEPLSTIRYMRTVRIVHFVIPANAGISGAALVVGSRVGARDDVPVAIPSQACKEPLSTIRYVGALRIMHIVIPANAGISGCGIGGEIPGRRPG